MIQLGQIIDLHGEDHWPIINQGMKVGQAYYKLCKAHYEN